MPNPYATDEHRHMTAELTAANLPIRGKLPEGLHGSFVRNSGNPAFPAGERYHWFDGDGMVHGVALNGGATYRNRWIQTPAFLAEREAGRPLWSGLNEPAIPDGRRGAKDTANTDVIGWNGQLVATWWLTGTPMALSLPELATLGPAHAGPTPLPKMSAHPKVDPRTGELVFFGYDAFKPPFYRYGTASPDGAVRVEPVELPHAHVPHDLAITEHYSVILDHPLGWDLAALAAGKRKIGFFRDRPARFGVIPRHGAAADIRWFEDEACYVYHLVGAWEEGDEIVLLGCRIADPIPAHDDGNPAFPRLDNIRLEPYLHRWRFHLGTGAVRSERLDDVATEFPRVDDRTWGRRVRHSYHPRVAPRSALMFDGVQKVDLDRGASQFHAWPQGWYSGEVVFAPRPGGTDDDDGWLVTALTSARDDASALVVLDAKGLDEVARVALPQRIPLGFHAEWVPAQG